MVNLLTDLSMNNLVVNFLSVNLLVISDGLKFMDKLTIIFLSVKYVNNDILLIDKILSIIFHWYFKFFL